jgi:hypothetical protein
MSFEPVTLDEGTVALYLKVAGSRIVLFQAIFETYEGLGTVRTIDVRKALVSVITTPSQVPDCQSLLTSIKPYFDLRCAAEELKEVSYQPV